MIISTCTRMYLCYVYIMYVGEMASHVLHSLLSGLSSLSIHELIVQSRVQHTGVFVCGLPIIGCGG